MTAICLYVGNQKSFLINQIRVMINTSKRRNDYAN